MKVVKWTNWYDPEYLGREHDGIYEQSVLEAIASDLRNHGYKFTGDYHQNGDYGAPVLDDGTICQYSLRGWGRVMSLAYSDEIDDSDGMGYCVWAWSPPPERMVVPNF